MRRHVSFAVCLFILLIFVFIKTPVESQNSGGTITGKILYAGTPPRPALVSMAKDPNCLKINAGKKTFDDKLIVGASGELKNAFISIKAGLPKKSYPAPAQPVTLDQRGCMYSPRVQGALVGQVLKVTNSDQTLHNIHSLSPKYLMNIAQPVAGMVYELPLKSEEVMLALKCEIHTWMESYVGVVTHPFFAVSSAAGTYEIKNVPPGKYTLQAWHDQFGAQTKDITVTAGQTVTADFSFTPKAAYLEPGFIRQDVLIDTLPSTTFRTLAP